MNDLCILLDLDFMYYNQKSFIVISQWLYMTISISVGRGPKYPV